MTEEKVDSFFALCYWCPNCNRLAAHDYTLINDFPYETNCRCGQEIIMSKPENLDIYLKKFMKFMKIEIAHIDKDLSASETLQIKGEGEGGL